MKRSKKKLPPPSLWLVPAGAFLGAEAGWMLFEAAGRNNDPGLFFALCAVELFCGFSVAFVNRRRSGVLLAVTGVLLLTLRAGVSFHPVAAVCSFLIAGGTAAFLARTRKRNTFLPFAAAFCLTLAGTAVFPVWAFAAASCLAILLSGVLIIYAVRLGHLRWLFFLLLPLQGLLFASDQGELRKIREYTTLRLAAASALPSALLPPQQEEGKISILQVTARPGYAELVPWRHIPFAEEPVLLDLSRKTPAGRQLEKLDTGFDLISIEFLPAWHPRALKQLFTRLLEKADPGGGVVVFPREMLDAVPPACRIVSVPGGENRRFAAGYGELVTDPVKLDQRLQKYLVLAGDSDFMAPGVFAGLYQEQKKTTVSQAAEKGFSRSHGLFFWCVLGVIWLFARLIFSRKGGSSAFFAAVDNSASAALIILTAFALTAFNRMDSHIPEWHYLWCILPAIPFWGKRGTLERILLLASLILPWLFVSGSGGSWHYLIVFAVSLIVAASAGITGAKLLLEQNASAGTLTAGTFAGLFAAGILFHLFFSPENIIPVLAAAVVLRLSCLLRR